MTVQEFEDLKEKIKDYRTKKIQAETIVQQELQSMNEQCGTKISTVDEAIAYLDKQITAINAEIAENEEKTNALFTALQEKLTSLPSI